MANAELKSKLAAAKSFDEVKEILKERSEINAEQVWKEIENHRSNKSDKLDLDELDAVSGGFDRDWLKDGCAATCERSSWCSSNDWCQIWDVTYDHFWDVCPDGRKHIFEDGVCIRCGESYPSPTEWWEDI